MMMILHHNKKSTCMIGSYYYCLSLLLLSLLILLNDNNNDSSLSLFVSASSTSTSSSMMMTTMGHGGGDDDNDNHNHNHLMTSFGHFKLESGNGGCIGIVKDDDDEDDEMLKDGVQLLLVDCDNDDDDSNSNSIFWSIDHMGMIHSTMDDDYCWTVYRGKSSSNSVGKRLRLYKCQQVETMESQMFHITNIDDIQNLVPTSSGGVYASEIRFGGNDDDDEPNNLCIVHAGNTANINIDAIVIKDCNTINDIARKEWHFINNNNNIVTVEEEEEEVEHKPTPTPTPTQPKVVVEFENPFEVDLPYFDSEVTNVYNENDLSDFDTGLKNAAHMIINQAIQRNVKSNQFWAGRPIRGDEIALDFDEGSAVVQTTSSSSMQAESAPVAMPPPPPPPTELGEETEVTDYETNVQEKGVDEADIIKADANYIYASYVDYIIVWDTFGKKHTQLKMPPVAIPKSSTTTSSYYWYNPKPHIDSLLLTSGYLVVFLSGNGRSLREENLSRPAVLYNYLDTQIRIYKTPNLQLVGTKNINGRYSDARSVGSNVYVVTTSGINTYSTLLSNLQRWNTQYTNMTNEEYYIAAQEQARRRNIPDFIKSMREELSASTGHFPEHMLRINRWQQTPPDDEAILDMSFTNGVTNNVAWITSFDVLQKLSSSSSTTTTKEDELEVSTSSFLTPYSWLHMYGTQNQIILATQGWNWNAIESSQEQTTYLLGLNMNKDGPSTEFISVGTIAGHLLNSFALDIHDGELRVATTIRRRIRWGIPIMPFPTIMDDIVIEDNDVIMMRNNNNDNNGGGGGGGRKKMRKQRKRRRMRGSAGGAGAGEDEDIMNNNNNNNNNNNRNLQELIELEPMIDMIPIPMPEPILVSPPREEQEESSTENYVIVLNLQGDDKGQMTEKGRVKIGEPHESITAIRFFDDFAYVVTFERTDPFYVIDLNTIQAIGEFKLNGFSSYLHPMTSDNTLLLGIGQNATNEGRITGLMITVFNATIPEDPVAVVSYTIENEEDRYSSSDAEWEHKSFRYINGKLILPLYESYQRRNPFSGRVEYDNFDGFVIFNVNTTSINEHFRVSHKARECHYCGGWLPPRSFIYEGNLITTKDSVITSTDLDTGDWLWTTDVVIDNENNDCCPYYLGY